MIILFVFLINSLSGYISSYTPPTKTKRDAILEIRVRMKQHDTAPFLYCL